ncbi:MAG: DUF2059 domain-containing protein [Mucilaginibacter sp.]
MKVKLTFIILTGILLLSFSKVKAQTAGPTFTESHLKAAENYMIATGINKKFGEITNVMINAFSKQIPESNRTAFSAAMEKFMNKYYTWDVLKGDLSKLYASEFTEDELTQLTAFFNTPLGQKYGDKMVILTQKGMMLGQQVVRDHQDELKEMMKAATPEKN